MRFPGIIPAVVTPFTAADTLDLDALRSNVAGMLEAGIHGLVATGTMGESASLELDERAAVVRSIVEVADGRVPVLSGIAAPTARTGARYASIARDAGADALMVLPPLNYSGDLREFVAFYRTIGEESGLPIMAYNNPGASGVEFSVAEIAALAGEVDSIVAIKECAGETRNIAAIIGATPDDLEVLVGGDDFALEGFCAGASGWVSGVANVIPGECVRLYDAVQRGELAVAREIYQRMLPLAHLDFDPKLVQYFKAGMDQVGFTGGLSREPRMPLTDEEQQRLTAAMEPIRLAAVS